jgi:hypothetical protein
MIQGAEERPGIETNRRVAKVTPNKELHFFEKDNRRLVDCGKSKAIFV